MFNAQEVYEEAYAEILSAVRDYLEEMGVDPLPEDIPNVKFIVKSIIEKLSSEVKTSLMEDVQFASNSAVPNDGGRTALTVLYSRIASWITNIS